MKPLLINGEWITTPHGTENINPSDTSDIVEVYAQGGVSDAQNAIEAAYQTAPQWAVSTPQQRHDILKKVGDELFARKEEIGRLLSREEGKTLPEGIAEANRASQIFDFFAGEALRLTGDKVPSVRPGVDVDITREPVGVVGIIAPWNFPIAIPAWKIAPAICYGNTVVMKPAELVPGCSWVLADVLHRAGIPAGVFNLVMGPGSVVGQELLENPKVEAISFTGSVGTGERVGEACMRHKRKVQLEMGGKNPFVVLDDADLEVAVECVVNGAFYSTGQRCTASSRIVVTEGIHNRFVEAIIERTRNLVVDDALKMGTQIGPVVDESQLQQDLNYVAIARSQGGNVRIGGEAVSRAKRGYYFQPALITDTQNDMRINREEVFGPVASVIRVKDYEEALYVANDTEFGLSSGIATTSLKHASHFKRHAQAGMVMVNLPTAGVDYHVPFGGTKGSSYGSREQGSYAKEFFTTVKTAYTAP
ncbi:MAG: aldehyde dehydrogenase family protein [Hyphomicrobiales bacterium]